MNIEFCKGVRITYPKDCGNSPKKIILVNLYKAFLNGDEKFILDNISDKSTWNIIGNKTIDNKNNIISTLNKYRENGIEEIQIMNLITHGSIAAVNGTIIFNDKVSFGFCDVYKFTGFGKKAKIGEVSSYVIKII